MHLGEVVRRLAGNEWYWRFSKWKNTILPNRVFLEEKKMRRERALFFKQFVKSGDLCFDVGANFGNRVEPLLRINAKVVAVEPQEICRRHLRWRFRNKIVVVSKGLGSKEETREFYIGDSHTLSSFSKEWIDAVQGRFSSHGWNKVEHVEMTTLDLLIKEFGLPVFIKIDAEGFELEILNGLNRKVEMISFEYTTPEQTERAVRCLLRLQQINPEAACNFSVGEGFIWGRADWMPVDRMIGFVQTEEFIRTGFGDIYVKNNTRNTSPAW